MIVVPHTIRHVVHLPDILVVLHVPAPPASATTLASQKPRVWLNKGCDGFGKSCTIPLKKVSGQSPV